MNIGVLFDMDGVLVDSEPVITAASMISLKEYGVDADESEFRQFTGMGEDMFIGGVARLHGAKYHSGMKTRAYEIYGEIVDERLEVYKGTLPLLQALKAAHIPMALASSADLVKVRHNLRVAGIAQDTFDAILSGDDVTDKKPHPAIYLAAAAKIGTIPEKCIVVEDALSGIAAGLAAGCRVIAVTTAFDAHTLKNAGATWIITDIAEVESIIKEAQSCA